MEICRRCQLMCRSSIGSHMKRKQQMCEINWTFDACARAHNTTHVAAFDSTFLMEVPPRLLLTWVPVDSLRGGSGPITKIHFLCKFNLMLSAELSFPAIPLNVVTLSNVWESCLSMSRCLLTSPVLLLPFHFLVFLSNNSSLRSNRSFC